MGISQEIPLTLDFQTKKKKIQKVPIKFSFRSGNLLFKYNFIFAGAFYSVIIDNTVYSYFVFTSLMNITPFLSFVVS